MGQVAGAINDTASDRYRDAVLHLSTLVGSTSRTGSSRRRRRPTSSNRARTGGRYAKPSTERSPEGRRWLLIT